MTTPLEHAWSVLKADARQIYDSTRQLARQTMNPNVATMARRENERRYKEHMEKVPGLMGELTSPPPARIELVGRPRNEYSPAAVKVGSRNYPTEGGPENETKLGPYDGAERQMHQHPPPVGG